MAAFDPFAFDVAAFDAGEAVVVDSTPLPGIVRARELTTLRTVEAGSLRVTLAETSLRVIESRS